MSMIVDPKFSIYEIRFDLERIKNWGTIFAQ